MSHCWARSAHGPHVRTHSCTKTGHQVAQCNSPACGVPQCVPWHSSHWTFVFSQGGEHSCQRMLPQSHWSHAWRQSARRGSHATQCTPRWVGYGRSAIIHFLAGVDVCVPCREMLEGEVGVKSGRGRVVASLASRSTSLLHGMSARCCASHVRWSVVVENLAHRYRLALDYVGGHLLEVNV